MKTLLLILLTTLSFAQSLKPVIGIKYTGGISYQMEHEYFSGQLGLQYKPYQENFAFADVSVNGEYIYDYLQEFNGLHNFYVARLQFAKPVNDALSFVYFGGYMGGLNNTTKAAFRPLKTNLTWGGGVRFTDDHLQAELLYENLGRYPHISVGVAFPLWEILK